MGAEVSERTRDAHMLGVLLRLVVLAVVIRMAILAVKRYQSRPRPNPMAALPDRPADPLAIARARYARGEITDAEFQRIVDNLARTERGPFPDES